MDRESLFPRIALWLASLSFGMLTVACDGGGGGGSGPTTLQFRNSNWGACESLVVDVDLDAAGAVLARRMDGSIDCELPRPRPECNASFEEVDAGRTLRVTLDCRIESEILLFHCAFSESDERALSAATQGFCDCLEEPVCAWNGAFCDRNPAVCVSASADLGACEDCSNGIDDDGNGEVDCDDSNCFTEECGYGTRSSSTVTCSSSTTTQPSSTTTLLLDLATAEDAVLTAP
ncbi:MAG: hypothetical protein LC667_18070 [Thioalkalivibrio sp.]|nr:hypothetical protein [Thioalkalivibrio sp.]